MVFSLDYETIFQQMPLPRLLISFEDGKFCIVDINKKGEVFFNKTKEKIIGQCLKDIFSEKNFLILSQSLQASFEKKLPVTVAALTDASYKMQSFGFWINPILNEQGDVMYLDVIKRPKGIDVSGIERERDDALSLLTSIFDASGVGILVFDRNFCIVKMNDSFERIYGWNEFETIGRNFLELITEDEKEIARKNYQIFLEKGERATGEVKIFKKDGTIANSVFTTAQLKLTNDRQYQVITLFDITDRKKMELSLRVARDRADAANNVKSSFLANMSHELRTPLNAIIGFSEMMVNEIFGELGNDKYKEYSSDVYLSAKHLLDIINEVLDMSKIESGKIHLDEQEVDLNALINSLLRVMRSRDKKENILIKERFQEDIPKLYADARLLRQILINLVTNSIKHSLNGGVIEIQTRLNDKNEIEIIVSDQGVGIPADRVKDALEPFGQIHDPSTHNKAYQGTGLGLPLAKAMVEMHGGDFTLTSVENEGTTVLMSFSSSRTRYH